MRRNPVNGEAAAAAVGTRRFPTGGEAVPKGLKGPLSIWKALVQVMPAPKASLDCFWAI